MPVRRAHSWSVVQDPKSQSAPLPVQKPAFPVVFSQEQPVPQVPVEQRTTNGPTVHPRVLCARQVLPPFGPWQRLEQH
jgi:hypothetical protein